MADDIELNVGSGGPFARAKDLGSGRKLALNAQMVFYDAKATLLDGNAASGSGIASLGNGLSYQTIVFDNSVLRYKRLKFRFKLKGTSTASGVVDVYMAESLGDTDYTDGITSPSTTNGSTFTTANRVNSIPLGQIVMKGTTAIVACLRTENVMDIPPSKLVLILTNNSGFAFGSTATDFLIEVEGSY